MSVKAGLVILLFAAAAVGGHRADAVTVVLLVLGVFNAVLTVPGTAWVRGIAILAICVTLAWPEARDPLVALLWILWPPAFLLAWSIGREEKNSDRDAMTSPRARRATAALIAALAVGALVDQGLVRGGLQQTAALFIGIPALMAIIMVFAVSPRSAVGVACKAVTIGLLVSLVFLGEGMVCVVMSAPLFYVVAIVLAKGLEYVRRGSGGRARTTFSFLAVIAFAPMSLEGVTEQTSFDRDEWVTETRIVHASSQQVEAALFQPPRFDRALPGFLRIGFPRPILTRTERHDGRLQWVIRFRGGEMRIDGIEPREGDLVLELGDHQPGLVTWRATTDSSHMTHFLNWREARVQWTPIDQHSTQVTWTLRYRRGLDPAWYFGPWERYATRLAAGYLIESVATP